MTVKYDTGYMSLGNCDVKTIEATKIENNRVKIKFEVRRYDKKGAEIAYRTGSIQGNLANITLLGEKLVVSLTDGYLFPN